MHVKFENGKKQCAPFRAFGSFIFFDGQGLKPIRGTLGGAKGKWGLKLIDTSNLIMELLSIFYGNKNVPLYYWLAL